MCSPGLQLHNLQLHCAPAQRLTAALACSCNGGIQLQRWHTAVTVAYSCTGMLSDLLGRAQVAAARFVQAGFRGW